MPARYSYNAPTITCKKCGVAVERTGTYQKFCSNCRNGGPFFCEQCGRQFAIAKPYSRRRPRWCSQACYWQSRRQEDPPSNRLMTCRSCGGTFNFGYHSAKSRGRKFCSVFCYTSSSRGKRGIQIGAEAIRANENMTERKALEWHVFIGRGVSSNRSWKPKSEVVIENAIGRQIKRCERPIQFIDGDRLNCVLENLLFGSRRRLRACVGCGVVREIKLSEKLSTEKCRRCVLLGKKNMANRKLSDQQISAIKGIDPRELYSRIAAWFSVCPTTAWQIRTGRTHKGISTMAKNEIWKALLKQHDTLKSTAAGTTFDRVTLLAKVYADEHYLAAMKANGRSPTKGLDKRLSDMCANFTELVQILKMFPKKSQWTKGDLGEMRLQMLEKLRAEQSVKSTTPAGKSDANTNGRKTAVRATVAQLRTEQDEVTRLKSELRVANKAIKSLERQVETLNDTIRSLRPKSRRRATAVA